MESDLVSGVVLTPLRIISAQNGDVLHAIKASDKTYCGFGEAYFSTVSYNSIKGWKKHHKMVMNIVVPVGGIQFVIFDDRIGTNSFNKFQTVVLSQNNYCRLTVPPGVWMGFKGVGKDTNILMNFSSILHDPSEAINLKLSEIKYEWESADEQD